MHTGRKIPESEQELFKNALGLTGRSLQQVANTLGRQVPANQLRAKGWTGELIEAYLGATAASLPEPDFPHLGIELKTIPIDENGKPRESTFVCMVPLSVNPAETWESSLLRRKLSRVLWVPVEAGKTMSLAERRLGRPFIWSPDASEEQELYSDWREHMDMINMGELQEINSSQGRHLQIRPKAANARALTATTSADGSASLTLPRGFYLRPAFTYSIMVNNTNR